MSKTVLLGTVAIAAAALLPHPASATGGNAPDTATIAPPAEEVVSLPDVYELDSLTKAQRQLHDQRIENTATAVDALMPITEKIDGYGGLYVAPDSNGRITVVTINDQARAQISEQLPPDVRDLVEFRTAEFSQDQLREAASAAFETLARADAEPISVAADLEGQQITVAVAQADFAARRSTAGELSRSVQVPVNVVVGDPAANEPAACTSRTNCTSPMKSGSRIQRGSRTGATCTMGFHVRKGSDEQFVTAGHCSHGSKSNNWYHQGFSGSGYIGSVQENIYDFAALDIMRVQLSDTQASDDVYGSIALSGVRNPIRGEGACASLGNSNKIVCGTITDDWLTYTSSGSGYCFCGQIAADASWSTIGGDSGSPVYAGTKAIGVNSTTGGKMVRAAEGLGALGVSLVT